MEEIRKIAEYPDRRIKAIDYTMTSSGIRLGAWDYLKWGNIKPVQRNGKVVTAKVIVYAGEDEEYFTFISLLPYQNFPWNYDNIHDASTLYIVIYGKVSLSVLVP
jgi:hypothetical protein